MSKLAYKYLQINIDIQNILVYDKVTQQNHTKKDVLDV